MGPVAQAGYEVSPDYLQWYLPRTHPRIIPPSADDYRWVSVQSLTLWKTSYLYIANMFFHCLVVYEPCEGFSYALLQPRGLSA